MSKGWRSQTLKNRLQLADKYLVKSAKEAKHPDPGCLNCLTTCKSNKLYPTLTSKCSSREQPGGQPKAQEIAVALSYIEKVDRNTGWRSVPLVMQCWKGWRKDFIMNKVVEKTDFESKLSHLCFRGCKKNLAYFSRVRKTQMTYRSLFLPEIFYNLGAEESSVQNTLFHHECDFSNSSVLPKHFFP